MLWRFTLTDYTFNPAGVTTVIEEPNGWNGITVKGKRDKKNHGFIFDIAANSLEFVEDGYAVIKDAYDDSGVFADTKITVEINCSENYRTFYEGKLKYEGIDFLFSDYCTVKIPVQQIGCLQTFNNRIEAEVDLHATETLEGTELTSYSGLSEEINIPSKPLPLTCEATVGFGESTYTFTKGSGAPSLSWGTFRDFMFGAQFLTTVSEFNTMRDSQINAVGSPIVPASVWQGGGFPFEYNEVITECYIFPYLKLFASLDVDITITVVTPANVPFTVTANVYHTNSVGAIQNTYTIDSYSDNINTGTQTFNLSGTTTQTINAIIGDNIQYVIYFQAQAGSEGTFDTSVTLTFNASSTIIRVSVLEQCDDDSPCKVAFINEALSRTSEIITDGCLRVYSEYFQRIDSQPYSNPSDGCGGLEAIANGLLIRRATRTDGQESKLFTSFKHLYEGLNAIHNIGMTIEEDTQGRDYMLRVEPVSYFYPYSVIHTINLPKEVKIYFDESRCYQTIQIGYDKWETEFQGGLDEFLTTREYRTELTTVDNKLEQVSKLIASGYAVEVTRREAATTEDSTYDNDIFILCLTRSGYTGFEVETHTSADCYNVLSDVNVINVRISPVRNLIRWFKSIASSWTKVFDTTSKDVIFNSGDGNYVARFDQNSPDSCWIGDDITENQIVDKNTEADTTPLWETEIIEINGVGLSWDDFLAIKADPKGLIKVEMSDRTLYGWIDEMNYKVNEGLCDWKLLRAFDAESYV